MISPPSTTRKLLIESLHHFFVLGVNTQTSCRGTAVSLTQDGLHMSQQKPVWATVISRWTPTFEASQRFVSTLNSSLWFLVQWPAVEGDILLFFQWPLYSVQFICSVSSRCVSLLLPALPPSLSCQFIQSIDVPRCSSSPSPRNFSVCLPLDLLCLPIRPSQSQLLLDMACTLFASS